MRKFKAILGVSVVAFGLGAIGAEAKPNSKKYLEFDRGQEIFLIAKAPCAHEQIQMALAKYLHEFDIRNLPLKEISKSVINHSASSATLEIKFNPIRRAANRFPEVDDDVKEYLEKIDAVFSTYRLSSGVKKRDQLMADQDLFEIRRALNGILKEIKGDEGEKAEILRQRIIFFQRYSYPFTKIGQAAHLKRTELMKKEAAAEVEKNRIDYEKATETYNQCVADYKAAANPKTGGPDQAKIDETLDSKDVSLPHVEDSSAEGNASGTAPEKKDVR